MVAVEIMYGSGQPAWCIRRSARCAAARLGPAHRFPHRYVFRFDVETEGVNAGRNMLVAFRSLISIAMSGIPYKNGVSRS